MNHEAHRRPATRTVSNRPGGFTLVELLVVVSIIALLIAILLPSLRRAREQSKNVVCMANLRSMGQAFAMYAEKYNGVWPPGTDEYNTNRWPVPFHRGGIITAQLATFDSSGKIKRAPDNSVFICPSEKAPRVIPDWDGGGTPHPVDRVEVGGSYGLNEEIHRKDGSLERGDALNKAPHLRKIDTCRRAADIYAVAENYRPLEKAGSPGWRFNRGAKENVTTRTFSPQGGAFWLGYRLYDGSPIPPGTSVDGVRIVGGHHMGRGNALCVDTHAESYRPDNIAYNQVSWERWPHPDKTPPGGL